MTAKDQLDAEKYEKDKAYVTELGKQVVRELLKPQQGETILDVGSGTGDLTAEIAKYGAKVTGVDISASLVERAKEKHPHIPFIVANAETMRFDTEFDAVFSNASLHWVKKAEEAVESIWLALRKGGRFVADLGGKGNIETIIHAVTEVLTKDYGINAHERNPFFFPSLGEYSLMLEKQGFRVTYAVHFDLPYTIDDPENGLNHWLDHSAGHFFAGMSDEDRKEAYAKVNEKVKDVLLKDNKWIIDYTRLRLIAEKM